MFEGEALGLRAMYDTRSIRVPLPYKVKYQLIFTFISMKDLTQGTLNFRSSCCHNNQDSCKVNKKPI